MKIAQLEVEAAEKEMQDLIDKNKKRGMIPSKTRATRDFGEILTKYQKAEARVEAIDKGHVTDGDGINTARGEELRREAGLIAPSTEGTTSLYRERDALTRDLEAELAEEKKYGIHLASARQGYFNTMNPPQMTTAQSRNKYIDNCQALREKIEAQTKLVQKLQETMDAYNWPGQMKQEDREQMRMISEKAAAAKQEIEKLF